MSNLKIDIIYYKTASDFEMEFNLSGCCRMRMFKDKVDTPKGLVNTLARDVSRSKITIVVTDLFGDNGGVATISKAIKLPLVKFNKEEYGVKTTDEIYIPQTAVPFVTKSGIYGGCIIENGPQSIIIVSNLRALRHEIMKAYVHNYVFDVAQLLAYQERMSASPVDEQPKVNIPVPVAIPTEKPENNFAKAEEPQIDSAEETVEEPDISSSSPESSPIILSELSPLEEFNLYNEETLNDIQPRNTSSKRKNSLNVILLIIVFLLLVGFGILAYYFVYMPLLQGPGSFSDGSGNVIAEFLNSLFS